MSREHNIAVIGGDGIVTSNNRAAAVIRSINAKAAFVDL